MILEYKSQQAKLTYCAKTKSYYGEILGVDDAICFQAISRHHAMQVMRSVVDVFLPQQDLASL